MPMRFEVMISLSHGVCLLSEVLKENFVMRGLMVEDPFDELAPAVALMLAGWGKVNGVGLRG
jgi:hypothetical protein